MSREGLESKPVVLITDIEPVYLIGLAAILDPAYEVIVAGETPVSDLLKGAKAGRAAMAFVGRFSVEQRKLDLITNYKQEGLPVIDISDPLDQDKYLLGAAGLKIEGYLSRNCSKASVLNAAQSIANGGSYIDENLTSRIMSLAAANGPKINEIGAFSEKELAVIMRVAQGERTKQIAKELSISERTVGNRISDIYDKTRFLPKHRAVRSRAGITRLAIEMGLPQIEAQPN